MWPVATMLGSSAPKDEHGRFSLLWRQFLLGGTTVGKLDFLQQRFSVASEIGVVVTMTLISGSKLTGCLPEVNISSKGFLISCFLIVSNVVSCLGRRVLWSFSGVIPTGLVSSLLLQAF